MERRPVSVERRHEDKRTRVLDGADFRGNIQPWPAFRRSITVAAHRGSSRLIAGSDGTLRYNLPVFYLITFACFGCHLHGDESGSVDPQHHIYGNPFLPVNSRRVASERQRKDQPAYRMDPEQRLVVLDCLRTVCGHRGWNLVAAHVRTTHLHVVVQGNIRPERIMHDLKSYASRGLNQAGFDGPERKRWARHGSTRWLGVERDENVAAAIRYILEEQGDPMAAYDSRSAL